MRNLTDEDIEALVKRLSIESAHACRFESIDKEDLRHSVEFYKNANKALSEAGSTARKTAVAAVVAGMLGIGLLGIVAKIKQYLVAP